MVKRLAIVVLALVVLGGSALADAKWGGVARELAMGGSQASSGVILNPFVMNDPSLLLLNPAYQTMYKDYVWMNIGGGTLNNLSTVDNGYGNQYSGVNFSLSKEVTLGAILSFDPSAVNAVGSLIRGITISGVALPAFTQRPAQTIPAVQNVIEGLVSFDLGALDVGFGVTYGSATNDAKSSTPTTSSETEASARMFGVRGGILYDLGGGSSVDLSAAVRMDKATDNITSNAGSGGEYSASGTEFLFAARAGLKVNNRVNLVPYGIVAVVSAEPKEDTKPAAAPAAQTVTEKLSALIFGVGLGAEYRMPSFYLAGGVSVQSAKAKLEVTQPNVPTTTNTYTYTAIPVFNIGAEWWWTEWLAGRGGYYRASGSLNSKIESATTTTESNQALPNSFLLIGGIGPASWDGVVTLGIGLKFGNFSLDATVSEEALRRGLGLIGAQDNINTFGYMTASYNIQ